MASFQNSSPDPLADPIRVVLDHGLRHDFQPIWDLNRGTLVGFEAMARFSERLTPEDVWYWAEESHLQNPLGHLSIVTALNDGKDLPGKLFLNVSAQYLKLDGRAMEELIQQILAWRPMDSVVLEITETSVENVVEAGRGAAHWQEQGLSLALDDAGVQASNQERLALLRPQYVKMDQGLLRKCVLLQTFVTVVNSLKQVEDTMVRNGGDEFLLICADFPLCEALTMAQSIRLATSAPDTIPGLTKGYMRMTVSVGLTESSTHASVEALFNQVDHALHQPKSQRNTVIYSDALLQPPTPLGKKGGQ